MDAVEPTYHGSDFRTYPPELVESRPGVFVSMTRCEELVGDRWEAFYSVGRPASGH